jgi:hypothetical protein
VLWEDGGGDPASYPIGVPASTPFDTWPERPGKTRSDSHAWSAHPAYKLLSLEAGIEPASPGFALVRVAPNLVTCMNFRQNFHIFIA